MSVYRHSKKNTQTEKNERNELRLGGNCATRQEEKNRSGATRHTPEEILCQWRSFATKASIICLMDERDIPSVCFQLQISWKLPDTGSNVPIDVQTADQSWKKSQRVHCVSHNDTPLFINASSSNLERRIFIDRSSCFRSLSFEPFFRFVTFENRSAHYQIRKFTKLKSVSNKRNAANCSSFWDF